ncbi:MAG: hypothetical protein Rubg2KO_27510 [Rubricoccaceae bacterium]
MATLAVGHVFVHVVYALITHPLFGLRGFFGMDSERSLPTFFSALLLLATSGLLTWVAAAQRREGCSFRTEVLPWAILAAGFLVMAIDEAAGIHDAIIQNSLSSRFGRGEGIFYGYWYLIYTPLVLVIAALYVPFLKQLPRSTAVRFVVAGAVYLGGALGVEAFTAAWLQGEEGLTLDMLQLVEESAEMLGVVLMIRALLIYLSKRSHRLLVEARRLGNGAELVVVPANSNGAPLRTRRREATVPTE